MDKVVSPNHTSFIPNRNIHENIVEAQKLIHSMNKLKGNKGFFAIKLDLAKAYDMMNWSYVEKVLKEVNIP